MDPKKNKSLVAKMVAIKIIIIPVILVFFASAAALLTIFIFKMKAAPFPKESIASPVPFIIAFGLSGFIGDVIIGFIRSHHIYRKNIKQNKTIKPEKKNEE